MVTVSFDWEGIVYHEYTPPGQTVNEEYFLNALHQLRNAIRPKRQQMWENGDWPLHQDNAPAHASRLVKSFSVKHQITQMIQPCTAQIWCPVTSGFSPN